MPQLKFLLWFLQVLSGLAYMNSREHGNSIIHYDLKPANILFNALGEVKLTVRRSGEGAEGWEGGLSTRRGSGVEWRPLP